jgi:protein involved in polysaccharide export with SLBB domain
MREQLMTNFGRRIASLMAVAILLAVAGCEDGAGTGPTASASGDGAVASTGTGNPPVYLIGPGDELNIIVFGHPDLSGNFVIDPQGDLTMPLIGRLPVRGKDVDTITREVTAAYGGSFLVDPRVSVELLNSRPFYILGQVNLPGEYPYVRGVTVRQAAAIAGGYTRRADTEEFVIYRQTETGSQELSATADTIVLPGDTVEVLRRLF